MRHPLAFNSEIQFVDRFVVQPTLFLIFISDVTDLTYFLSFLSKWKIHYKKKKKKEKRERVKQPYDIILRINDAMCGSYIVIMIKLIPPIHKKLKRCCNWFIIYVSKAGMDFSSMFRWLVWWGSKAYQLVPQPLDFFWSMKPATSFLITM